MKRIRYQDGYKYQLVGGYTTTVAVYPGKDIVTAFIELNKSGQLMILPGYAWDGPSGPTIDTKNFMRGSLVHDALYQLMRDAHLPASWRKTADEELRRILLEDGMSSLRAWWVYQGVRFGGGPAADPANAKEVHSAP